MPRLLVVEDERKLLRSLRQGLQAAGFHVETAANGDDGARLGSTQPFDCVVLDWMLPGRDGLQVIDALRQARMDAPILLLTARDAVEDRVLGLESGADDYLVKPFAFAELVARIRVLLRRGRPERETVLRAGTLEMDLLNRRVSRAGVEVPLTQREFEVLEYLLRHKNEPVTRAMLGRDVWKEPGYAHTNVIDVYIDLLRRKLGEPGSRPQIATLRGLGYTLQE